MKMTTVSHYCRVAPRKLQLVADAIKSLSPEQALVTLSFMQKSGAVPFHKVIASALVNARAKNLDTGALAFSEIVVLPGGAMKRFRAVSRGMAHTYKKRMSHIKIVLTDNSNTKTNQNEKLKMQNDNVKSKNK